MITELTEENYEAMAKYRDLAIGIILKSSKTFDENLVTELFNKHLVLNKQPELKNVKVFDSPMEAVKKMNAILDEPNQINYSNAFQGNQDASWLTYYLYYRCELGLVKETEPLKHLIELSKHVGWFWYDGETAVFTKLPVRVQTMPKTYPYQFKGELSTFKSFGLHCENDGAIEYANGDKIYFLYNLNIPDEFSWIVTTPAKDLEISKILSIPNTEIKSVALKKIGIERAFDEMDKKLIHEKVYPIGGKYQLFSINVQDQERTYLKMECPSKGEVHIEAVHPDCQTVDAARGWRNEGGFVEDSITLKSGYVFEEPFSQS